MVVGLGGDEGLFFIDKKGNLSVEMDKDELVLDIVD